MKLQKLSPNQQLRSKMCRVIEEKLNIQNAAFFYYLTKLFNFPSAHTTIISYIERCFTIVVETQNFLDLDFKHLSKILASSGLGITSEVEVYNAADHWMRYNIEERGRHAESLLSKVRLVFLTDRTIRLLLNDSSAFSKVKDFLMKLKEATAKGSLSFDGYRISYASRHCDQKSYKVLLCGGFTSSLSRRTSEVNVVYSNSFGIAKALPPMIEERAIFNAVCVKGELYVLGNYSQTNTVNKFSPATNVWSRQGNIQGWGRLGFFACAFMDKIYVMGGFLYNLSRPLTASCLQFSTKNRRWKEVSRMKEGRTSAACAVFQGRIVVAGGGPNLLNTVESYDVLPDEWSEMPIMITAKVNHSLVAVKNKMFVFSPGANDCEVFDGACKKFVSLKLPELVSGIRVRAVSVEKKIFVFQEDSASVICYDIEKNEWSYEPCEVTKNLKGYSCVKIPSY